MKTASRIAGGIASSLLLALLPKCPVCIATYIAMLTGLGVSMATAAVIKTSLATVCVLALLWLSTSTLLGLAKKGRKCAAGGPVDRLVPH
jgi:hypothetical protein